MIDYSKVSEVSISYNPKVPPKERQQITCAPDTVDILKNSWVEGLNLVECFRVILLNRNNKVLGVTKISQGGYSGTVADPKVIFSIALKAAASCIILAHNHPSGNTKPSQTDIELTKKLIEGGKLLDIKVLDHIILTEDSYLSMLDEGLI